MTGTTMSIISGIFLLCVFLFVGWRASRRDETNDSEESE
jgi:hypothetical protein